MYFQIALLIFSIIMMRGCCTAPNRVEPPFPNASLGWNYREERGVHVLGDFVLHKGEATSNNKFQVKVLDLLHGDACAEPAHYLYRASASLQFIRLSDNKVLCEKRIFPRGSSNLAAPFCSDELVTLGLGAINLDSINLKDGWVYFQLLE